MAKVKHSPTQKERSKKRTETYNSLMKSLIEPHKITKRVSTILDPNDNCFHEPGDRLYIGTTLEDYLKYGLSATPKGPSHSTIKVQDTIHTPKNRYGKFTTFVVTHVIDIGEDILKKKGVNTIVQLEQKIRDEHNFISDSNYEGREWWKGKTCSEVNELVRNYLFDGKKDCETYEPRIPQKRAIEKIINAFISGKFKEFLFGAIMRFGKNFTFLYALSEILKNKKNAKILVWTNEPGVFETLEKDVKKHIKFSDFQYFSLKKNKSIRDFPARCVVTASKQLLENDKNSELLTFIESQEWDFIVIDEVHSGIETKNGQEFLKKFKNTPKIFISGTPQKQIGKIQFTDENTFIYDERDQKKDKESGIWVDAIILNPKLIKLGSDKIENYKEYVDDGTGYFSFTKFFRYNRGLVYKQNILQFFLNFFGYNLKTPHLNQFGKHNHIVIMMPSGIKAIEDVVKLLSQSVMGDDYEFIAATGSKFKKTHLDSALLSGKKTLTIVSDMLIEGTTVPEWDCAINMSDGTSIFKYLQFAFRPTNPNPKDPNKEAFFYDLNPQRLFLIINERERLNGKKGIEREEIVRSWFKNFDVTIMIDGDNFYPVDFEILKKESYNSGNMMRSISGLIEWGGMDILEMSNDLNGVKSTNLLNGQIELNDNGIHGGKNSKIINVSNKLTKDEKISLKEMEEIKQKFLTILSKVPYVLHREECYTFEELLEKWRNKIYFEFGFGVKQNVFEKYWCNKNFIDKQEMDLYFKNFAESI
jgi:superfamily II DNA or RNA helicase